METISRCANSSRQRRLWLLWPYTPKSHFYLPRSNAIWYKLTKTKQAACPLGAIKEPGGSSRCRFCLLLVHSMRRCPFLLLMARHWFTTQTKGNRVNWIFAITLAIFHLAALAAFFCFRWPALIAFVVVWVLAAECRDRDGLPPPANSPRICYSISGWSTALLPAVRLPCRAGPFTGWVFIACTTDIPIRGEIRIRRATGSGGPIWDGS